MKDSTGRLRTASLFVETIQKDQLKAGFKPLYTLKGKKGYEDLHDVYMQESDPTEYQFALRAFGSWSHFKKMESLEWFRKHLMVWRDELEVKLRSEGIKELSKAAKEGTRGISAAKYLAERGWEKKRGRPSKEEVERERSIRAQMEEELADDAARLTLVNG
jgi:hypothetical protein